MYRSCAARFVLLLSLRIIFNRFVVVPRLSILPAIAVGNTMQLASGKVVHCGGATRSACHDNGRAPRYKTEKHRVVRIDVHCTRCSKYAIIVPYYGLFTLANQPDVHTSRTASGMWRQPRMTDVFHTRALPTIRWVAEKSHENRPHFYRDRIIFTVHCC